MWKLTEEQRNGLLNRPESGMGYQFVQATTLHDNRTKSGVVYNAEVLLLDDERDLLKLGHKTLLRTARSAIGEIKSVQFDPRPRPTTLRTASATKSAPAKDASEEKTKAGEIFKRFSAYDNDNRVKPDRSLRDGTYATTEDDAKNVTTGKEAVDRYALPNPEPACYRYTIKPEKDTPIKKGIVEPAYGQRGGGVEVIFTSGTTAYTVTLPPDTIEKE